jgi:NADPH:quinone reductase-like Zn-dependent oxidoreductase
MPLTVQFDCLGPPEVLQLVDTPLRHPGPGEVRLRVAAVGLNRSEVQFRRGEYPLLGASFPARLGKEAAGVVDAVGHDVTTWSVGDHVTTIPSFDMQRYGVYCEYAIVPAFALAPRPPGLDWVKAAAIWQQYLTAYGPLHAYSNFGPDDHVLVTAASSSVGRAGIEFAKLRGASVIATSRTPEKAEKILAGGADHVILTADPSFRERVFEITAGRGVKVVFDPVAGPRLSALAEVTMPEGTIFLYGLLDERPAAFPLIEALKRGLTFRGYTLWEIVLDEARLAAAKDFILGHLHAGTLEPVIDRTFPLDEIVEAHAYMESNQQNGKIVVTVDPGL